MRPDSRLPTPNSQLAATMPTTLQMLDEYYDALLEVIAELRNAVFDNSGARQQVIERLAAELASPISIQSAYQDLVDEYPDVARAVDLLLKEGGEVREATFSRDYGSVRQMGPAKLEREAPYLNPTGVAEILYYYGLIGRGFSGAGQSAHTIVYLPNDIVPWLPRTLASLPPGALNAQPAPTPQRARIVPVDDALLEDAGSLLGFLHVQGLRLTDDGPHPEDLERLTQRLQYPFDASMADQETRLDLLLHLAKRLGWLRLAEPRRITLTGNRVRAFLELTRAEQRQALFDAWRSSPEWNDLLKTPALHFPPGALPIDPLQCRSSLLTALARISPVAWYRISTLATAIKESDPTFLRTTGNYDEWAPLDSTTQERLAGFEHWEAVEGALIRSLLRGPLHWLGAVDLAEPTAGDDWQMSLTAWGARWLGLEVEQPVEPAHRSINVRDDFTVVLPLGASLEDRFRVERFALWQASYPEHVFQISQRSLKRAADEGIQAGQILDFLSRRTRILPDKVTTALQRYARAAITTAVDTPAKRV